MSENAAPRQQAAGKREARKRRIHELRTRIAAIAVALFVAAWAGLYVQLVSGHDPALAGTLQPATQSADPETTSDDGSDDAWTGESFDTGTASDETSSDGTTQAASSSEPAAVTTRQS